MSCYCLIKISLDRKLVFPYNKQNLDKKNLDKKFLDENFLDSENFLDYFFRHF